MRLSDAILLGSSLCKAVPGGSTVVSPSSVTGEGCALDMANLAIGDTRCWVYAEDSWKWLREDSGQFSARNTKPTWQQYIAEKFDNEVMLYRLMSFEEFVDWVRAIEPPEEEPTGNPTVEQLTAVKL